MPEMWLSRLPGLRAFRKHNPAVRPLALLILVMLLGAIPAATRERRSRGCRSVSSTTRASAGRRCWSQNLAAAEAAHASVVHALVDWATVAPTRPAHPLDGNDPAYHLSDIDALVVRRCGTTSGCC